MVTAAIFYQPNKVSTRLNLDNSNSATLSLVMTEPPGRGHTCGGMEHTRPSLCSLVYLERLWAPPSPCCGPHGGEEGGRERGGSQKSKSGDSREVSGACKRSVFKEKYGMKRSGDVDYI